MPFTLEFGVICYSTFFYSTFFYLTFFYSTFFYVTTFYSSYWQSDRPPIWAIYNLSCLYSSYLQLTCRYLTYLTNLPFDLSIQFAHSIYPFDSPIRFAQSTRLFDPTIWLAYLIRLLSKPLLWAIYNSIIQIDHPNRAELGSPPQIGSIKSASITLGTSVEGHSNLVGTKKRKICT